MYKDNQGNILSEQEVSLLDAMDVEEREIHYYPQWYLEDS